MALKQSLINITLCFRQWRVRLYWVPVYTWSEVAWKWLSLHILFENHSWHPVFLEHFINYLNQKPCLPGPVAQSAKCLATESSFRSRGCDFYPGLVPYLHGDWLWNNFYCHSPPFGWIIQEGLLSVTRECMCTKYCPSKHVYMGPIWVQYGLPIWGVQPGSAWVPYGLAHMSVAQMGPIWVPYNSPIKKKEMI